jgi:peptide deformylase
MAVLNVRKYGDPALRRRAKPVETVTPEIERMIADMVDTMYDEVGLGLAAPQVGISLRLMVVGDDDGREARALINPVIAEQGGEIVAEEGCLSIPGVFAPVKRAEWVRLEAQDQRGQPVSITARGRPPARDGPSRRRAVHRPAGSHDSRQDQAPHPQGGARRRGGRPPRLRAVAR